MRKTEPCSSICIVIVIMLELSCILPNIDHEQYLFSCLCSELLLTKHVEYFHSWMYPLSHELILHSIRNPLVSGFYKLLSVTMKIAKRTKYYQVMSVLFLCRPLSRDIKGCIPTALTNSEHYIRFLEHLMWIRIISYNVLQCTAKWKQLNFAFEQGVGLRSSTSPQSDAEKSACFALFSKFGKEVGSFSPLFHVIVET